MIIGIIIAAVVLLLLFYVIGVRNKLTILTNKVDNEWSQINILLKKRFDLIPNLVETIKGYAKHESETFEKVISARNKCLSATTPEESIASNNELTNVVTRLFALSESYPELKANTNFLDLQNQLKDIEDKIAYARQFYNDCVLKYNNAVTLFPSNIVAGIFGFKKKVFFEVKEEERENVQVKF